MLVWPGSLGLGVREALRALAHGPHEIPLPE